MRGQYKEVLKKGLLYIFYLTGSALMLLPFFWMISTAFKPDNQIFTVPIRWIPSPIYFKNFTKAFEVIPVIKYMFNTVIIAVLKIGGEVFVSALVAYGFARFDFKFKNVLFIILLATMMLPYEVTMIPTFIMWSWLGLSDSYVPLILPAYFGSVSFIFFLRMYFSTFPKDTEEAMVIDGANYLQIFFKLILPLGKPALVTIGLWAFLGTWNDLLGQLIYINDPAKYTIQLGLASFSNMTGETLWGPLMAVSFIALIPVVFILLFAQKYFVEGIKMAGIKG
ncbi:MAG: carbohydrate ABC transporter permease [Clostridiaceae bacterium]|jgi:multiple sugar transport system permease protein|nr:carbohydrate ABC transporter permease [Clostridiaceae bacterium]